MDREKVIKAIECCVVNHTRCFDDNGKLCPYFSTKVYMCEIELLKDALALLKKQEAVEPIPPIDDSDLWRCGNCGHQMFRVVRQLYCPKCGQAVKWK